MNNEIEPNNDPSFEERLRSLAPAPANTSEAEAMYACGYRAGIEAAAKSSSSLSSSRSGPTWSHMALAAIFSCVIVGPTCFLAGNQGFLHPDRQPTLTLNARSDSQSDTRLPATEHHDAAAKEPGVSSETPGSGSPIAPITSPGPIKELAKEPSTSRLPINQQHFFLEYLTKSIESWFGFQQHKFANSANSPAQLTSRSITDWNSITDGPPQTMPLQANRFAPDFDPPLSYMRYIDSFRKLSTTNSKSKKNADLFTEWL